MSHAEEMIRFVARNDEKVQHETDKERKKADIVVSRLLDTTEQR